MQERCHLFSTSCCTSTKTNTWTDTELEENARELYKLLKSCKYMYAKQNHESAVSVSYQVANNIQDCNYDFEDDCTYLNVGGIILDVEEFLNDNKQFEGEKRIRNTIQ